MNYISTDFSIRMLKGDANVSFKRIDFTEIPAKVMSAFGLADADTARVVSNELGMLISVNRINVHLYPGDVLYIAQVVGGSLPEGTERLPDGRLLRFFKVEIND